MLPPRRPVPRSAVAIAALCALHAGCSRSSSSAPPRLTAATTTFGPSSVVALDEVLLVQFAAPLDPASLGTTTVQLRATSGPDAGAAARGTWRVDGRLLTFTPALPDQEPIATSGGLQPDTAYELRITGGEQPEALRRLDGRPLEESLRYPLRTRAGNTAAELFAGNLPLGPQPTAVQATPRTADGRWRLGRSSERCELRLQFDQPLDPSESNLPRTPTDALRGPIQIVYDDPEYGPGTWVPADVELERNAQVGATVVLRPRGVLPSGARLRVLLSNQLRDLWSEDRGNEPVLIAATIGTEQAYAPQFDAIAIDFARAQELGAADFPEVPAIVADGALRVPDAFPAVEDVGDWEPEGPEVVLRTDEQTLRYTNGPDRTFRGGVLHVRNLHIRQGQVVRGLGPNPLVLVVDGDAQIDGVLSASGANGASLAVLGQYRGVGDVVPPHAGGGHGEPVVPSRGPSGGPAGGAGGSHAAGDLLHAEAPGWPAPGTNGGGGGSGQVGCDPCSRSSGGGGGAAATQGDPWYPSTGGTGSFFAQRAGIGGFGCAGAAGASTRTLVGGTAGADLFRDPTATNDFWGDAYEPRLGTRRRGELAAPVGGSGGGAGGSRPVDGNCATEQHWNGEDGGGGGGVLVLQVRGTLTVGSTGRIEANGGSGYRRALPYFDLVGGGGGGAGGMVVLMAGEAIVLHAHGETFANRNYDFAISADGGVCRTASIFAPIIPSKYPANGQLPISGAEYDSVPLGGFGGLGVIQLMVPVGTDNADGTNTVLDDAITIVRNGTPLQGAEKQRFLGWRGYQDQNHVYVDDFGMPTGTIGGMGDLRPDPILMPAPFTNHGRARARSSWLPLAGRVRRSVAAPDDGARAVVGPSPQFTNPVRADGWLPFAVGRLGPASDAAALLPAAIAIAARGTDSVRFGRPVPTLRLATPLPNPSEDAYNHCVAVLRLQVGGNHQTLRVLGNTADTLFFEPSVELTTDATHVQLHADYSELASQEPGSYFGYEHTVLPRANARLGFAFHRDPERAATSGYDAARFPAQVGTFLTDFTDPHVTTTLQAFGATHLQWDALLDGEFARSSLDQPPPADAGSAIALRRFWLPIRF